jgi:hypothetical protein
LEVIAAISQMVVGIANFAYHYSFPSRIAENQLSKFIICLYRRAVQMYGWLILNECTKPRHQSQSNPSFHNNDIRLEVGKYFHQIDLSVVNREIIVRVKLFAIFDVPEYLVVVGRVRQQ